MRQQLLHNARCQIMPHAFDTDEISLRNTSRRIAPAVRGDKWIRHAMQHQRGRANLGEQWRAQA